MRIEITSQRAILGLKTNNATLELTQNHQSLDLQSSLPQVRVEGTLPKVEIDSYQPRAEAGLKGNLDMLKETSQIARQAWLQGIGKNADQGTEMANIQNGGNPIVSQAEYNAYTQFEREWNMGTVPRSKPDIQVIEGQLDIQVIEGEVNNNTQKVDTEMQYSRGNVEKYMEQYNSINFEVVEDDRFDMTI